MKIKRLAAGAAGILLSVSVITAFIATAENSPETKKTASVTNSENSEDREGSTFRLVTEAGKTVGQEAENGCAVEFVDVKEKTATADLKADVDCTLIVAAYEEDGVKMLSSAITKVSAGAVSASVTFEDDLPEYYYISAYLVDSDDYRPLCKAFSKTVFEIDPQKVDEKYHENSDSCEVKSAVSTNMFSEAEVLSMLSGKGFTMYPVTFDHDENCELVDEMEASPDSTAKHPTYQTVFFSENSGVWVIDVVGKTISANPVEYNMGSNSNVPVFLSETETIQSLFAEGKKIYDIKPLDSAARIKTVAVINAETLNSLTAEEVGRS